MTARKCRDDLLPDTVDPEVNQTLHTLVPPFAARFTCQIGPAALGTLPFAGCPDPGDDRLVREWVMVHGVLVVKPAVARVTVQDI